MVTPRHQLRLPKPTILPKAPRSDIETPLVQTAQLPVSVLKCLVSSCRVIG